MSLENKVARTEEAAEDAGGVQDAVAIAHEEHAEHDDGGDGGAVEHLDAHHRRVLVSLHHPACIDEMMRCACDSVPETCRSRDLCTMIGRKLGTHISVDFGPLSNYFKMLLVQR